MSAYMVAAIRTDTRAHVWIVSGACRALKIQDGP